MSDSSDDNSVESTWVPYAQRGDWSDVRPLDQDEGPYPVVQIAYSDKFKDVFGYFRAVFASGEVSQRALDLTADALDLNPANYTIWHHRRHLLKELGGDLHAELEFSRGIIEVNPKNYQVWLHRQVLVEWIQDPSKELRLTEIVLSQDAKNYHAWQQRQWVIKTFGLFENELEFAERLIEDDIRNNSAWNQRFFVISNLHKKLEGDVLKRELEFTLKSIEKVMGNESSWNYLCGLIDKSEEHEKVEIRQRTREFCTKWLNDKALEDKPPIYLLATLVEINKADGVDTEATLKHCDHLANEIDVIRKEYWSYVKRSIHTSVVG